MYNSNNYQYAAEETSSSIMGSLVPLAGYIGLGYVHGKLQNDAIWNANRGFKKGAWRAFKGPSKDRNERIEEYVKGYWKKSKGKYNTVSARARETFQDDMWKWTRDHGGGSWNPARPRQAAYVQAARQKFAQGGATAGSMTQKAFKSKTRTAMAKLRLSRLTAAGLGVANFLFIAPLLYDTAKAGYAGLRDAGSMLRSANMGSINLPQMAATERQRALSALHNSELSARSALGNEASYYHR
jgi:hypothetical protein